MNHVFSQHVRNTAFHLTLTEAAIVDILNMWHSVLDCRKHNAEPHHWQYFHFNNGPHYLIRRGLVDTKLGEYWLTPAGELVAQLLIEAGFAGTIHPNTTMFPVKR